MKRKLLLTLILGLFLSSNAYALDLSRVKSWSAGEILTAADLNAEFNNITNHAITNNDVSATAGIVASKLNQAVAGAIGATTPSTGAFTTLSATGNSTFGDGADTVTFNSSLGITYTPVTTWTFTAAQTVSGTWADLGVITTADINGGTIDGVTIGGASAGAGTFTSVTTPSLTATGNLDIGTYELRANTLQSDVATGTAPLTVASTTKVTNLNADSIDGIDGTYLSNRQLFTSTGTFTAPTGVTTVYVTMCGGGGGGGGAESGNNWAGGGGGAQTIIKRKVAVTASNPYSVTVGTGGAGGAAGSNNGIIGTASSFAGDSETVTALPGNYGMHAPEMPAAGGAGGGTLNATTNVGGGMGMGGNGANGVNGSYYAGGGGGCFGLGVGGNSGGSNGAGSAGTGFGSGGGGGADNHAGGAGAAGFVLVEY